MIIKVIVVITEEVIITTEGQCIRITTGREIIMTTATVTLTGKVYMNANLTIKNDEIKKYIAIKF